MPKNGTGVFEDIVLQWPPREGGKQYTIPSNRVMGAIARIEDQITLAELTDQNRRAPLAKVASAYASVLRYAGARGIADDEVYAEIFPDLESAEALQMAVANLLLMMMPPDARRKALGDTAAIEQVDADEDAPRPTEATNQT